MQQQQNRKRQSGAASESPPCSCSPSLSLSLSPCSSWEITSRGERRDVVVFSLKCSFPPTHTPSVHLWPPQHNDNLPVCCNQTFPSSSRHHSLVPSSFPASLPLLHPLLAPLPQLPPHRPHQNPNRLLLIILIGGVRRQFHLSSPLHSSAGHSITFRCSDADVAAVVGGEEGGANDEPPSPRSLGLSLLRLSNPNLFLFFFLPLFSPLDQLPPPPCLCPIYPSESLHLSPPIPLHCLSPSFSRFLSITYKYSSSHCG